MARTEPSVEKPTVVEEFATEYAAQRRSLDEVRNRIRNYQGYIRDLEKQESDLEAKLAVTRRCIAEETGLVSKVRVAGKTGDAAIPPLTKSDIEAINDQFDGAVAGIEGKD